MSNVNNDDSKSTAPAEAQDGSKDFRQNKIRRTQHPQKDIDAFWQRFKSRYPGKAFTLLPKDLYKKKQAENTAASALPRTLTTTGEEAVSNENNDSNTSDSITVATSHSATASYDAAVAACKAKVGKIKRECEQVNQKYCDLNFDIEEDLNRGVHDCLKHLDQENTEFSPGSVKRVSEVFDDPQFYIDDATASDVRQGRDANCWLLAAICALCYDRTAMQRICIVQEPEIGVYGFVFHRDGEWFPEVIDDKLYLTKPNYHSLSQEDLAKWMELRRKDPENDWRKQNQKGSQALYFASCMHPQETWVPLLEKAYAKAHNDYIALEGGFFGEAVEDLTGGVTSEVSTSAILKRDKFWTDELMHVNKTFFFGCSVDRRSPRAADQGLHFFHAYSILEAKETKGKRLLKIRNPWGKIEWQGPWSDGSEEWTGEWIKELNHKFGDDGIFWISYEDFLRKFTTLDRTRLFGPEWQITQLWAAIDVPWAADYLETHFDVTLKTKTSVVFVLSQLDPRYFLGLEGPYRYKFQFRVQRHGEDFYIVRSRPAVAMNRSTSAELNDLEAGTYSVRFKITATVIPQLSFPEDVVKELAKTKREKLLRVAFQYDYAHAKARFRDTEQIRKEQEDAERIKNRKATKIKEKDVRKKIRLRLRRRQEKIRLAEKRDAEKLDAEKLDAEKLDAEKLDAEKLDAEKLDAKKLNAEKLDAEKIDAMKRDAGKGNAADGTKQQPSSPIRNPDALLEGTGTATETTVARPDTEANTGDKILATSLPPHSSDSQLEQIVKKRLTLDDISDSDASWDSDLDGPWPLSKGGDDIDIDDYRESKQPDEDELRLNSEEENDMDTEPWNAICVVGLRIYSENTNDGDIKIELIRHGKQQGETKVPRDVDALPHDGAASVVTSDSAQLSTKQL